MHYREQPKWLLDRAEQGMADVALDSHLHQHAVFGEQALNIAGVVAGFPAHHVFAWAAVEMVAEVLRDFAADAHGHDMDAMGVFGTQPTDKSEIYFQHPAQSRRQAAEEFFSARRRNHLRDLAQYDVA